MRDEVATLRERMSQGGDWRVFRDEIAALHAQDNTEAEYVALIEAHGDVMAMADKEGSGEAGFLIVRGLYEQYEVFLEKEATEDGDINPVWLERVTRREINAGRLDPESVIRKFAVKHIGGDRPKRSAVWGGATFGLVVGIGLKFFMTGATWWIVAEAVLIGAGIGFVAELLPRLFSRARA